MLPTAQHRTAEARFRALTDAEGLPPPDRVEYRPACVVFFWDGPRVAVTVDLPSRPGPPLRRKSHRDGET